MYYIEYSLFIKTKLKNFNYNIFFTLIGYILETFIRNEKYQADLTFVVEEEALVQVVCQQRLLIGWF